MNLIERYIISKLRGSSKPLTLQDCDQVDQALAREGLESLIARGAVVLVDDEGVKADQTLPLRGSFTMKAEHQVLYVRLIRQGELDL